MIYNDPLHVSWDTLTVYYNYIPQFILNKRLLDQQNAWDNLEDIKEAHVLKLIIYDVIRDTEDAAMLKSLAVDLTLVEFELQRLWGFTSDANFHRFWETPKCQCPVLDNEDLYPHRSIINTHCPLHGSK